MSHRLSIQPRTPVNIALTINPAMISGFLPSESASLPENCKHPALPTAKAARTMPATAVPLGNSMAANKGTVDTRTPKFTQPLANPDIKALR